MYVHRRGRLRQRLATAAALIIVAATALVAVAATPAFADTTLCSGNDWTTCPNAGYTDHSYGAHNTTSYWTMTSGHNCTNYVAYAESAVNGAPTPSYNLGSAYQWAANASAHGVLVNATPARGAVAQWNESAGGASLSGHVAYVESVNGDGSITLSEDNFSAGPFRWRTISAGSAYWPSNFIHFKDLPSRHQFLADVTGDGKADAVVYYSSGSLAGNWYVAPSTGSSFAGYSLWIAGNGVGSDKQFLADVTGDGKADAVMYWSNSGTYYVAPSTGSAFAGATQWSTGQIAGSNNQLMGDVNGDGKADAVVFSAGNGTWYASLSNGSSFTGFGQWTTGHGAGSTSQMLADVTGDGKADAVAFFGAPNGWWYVAPSTGSAFGGATQWANGYGSGSDNQFLADTSGDGKADGIPYFGATNGWWYVAPSNGSTFTGAGLWANGYGVNSSNQLIADVNGDGKADAIVYEGAQGNWWVALSTGSVFGSAAEWDTGFGVGS